jgi:hypothetical protein
MKKTIITFIALLLTSSIIYAQNCDAYIPTEKGKVLMYKTTNKKGKVQSYHSQELIAKTNKNGGVEFQIHHINFDEKKTKVNEDTMIFICKNNVFYIDMSSYLNEEQLKSFDESQIEITFDNIGYPTNLKPGVEMEDGYVEAKINAGMPLTFRTDIQDRRVEANEKITTEAGTFETLKVSEKVFSKVSFATIKMSSVSWISKNIGTVRSEVYDKKGGLMSVSELIEIK